MDGKKINLIGKCGFYCASCPTYTKGKCPSCRLAHSSGDCFTFDCVDRKKIDYCPTCKSFPCEEIMTREKATVLDPRWLKWKKEEGNR